MVDIVPTPDSRGPVRLVCLPGMDGTGELFGPFVRALPPSLPATVVSYPPDRPLGYADLLPLVEAAIPAEGPYAVVAESFSGPLGILHAASRPPRLRALVLSATFASNPLPVAIPGLGALASAAIFRIRPTDLFVRNFLTGEDALPELLALVHSVAAKVDPGVMAFRLREVLAVDVEEALPRVEVPVLYLRAARDRVVARRAMDRIAARAPRFEEVVLDAHHLLLQARPAETAAAVARLLAAAS